ncbi:MAG: heme-binding protein, partial [Verrucomicrobiales bacterium]|nr:heme-binding protein [Verrucomicrobiales bacterium]
MMTTRLPLLLLALLTPSSALQLRADDIAAAATPVSLIHVAKDFKVELLYSVPKGQEGSWVSMCHDDKGRLLVSDQYGRLYRVTPPAADGSPSDTKSEQIDLTIGAAQGMV